MASFDLFQEKLLDIEGGYQDNPNDRGNYNADGELVGTNYGIAAFTLEAWLNRTVTKEDMLNLTQAEAITIFKSKFWDKHRLSEVTSQPVAEIICDGCVNHGAGSRTKRGGVHIAQVVLNQLGEDLTVDGALGSRTLAAINRQIKTKEAQLYNRYKVERIQYYHDIVAAKPSQAVFLQGWLNRMDEFVTMAEPIEVVTTTTSSTTDELQKYVEELYYFTAGLTKVRQSDSSLKEWSWVLVVIAFLLIGFMMRRG